jgi:hypothetical protein
MEIRPTCVLVVSLLTAASDGFPQELMLLTGSIRSSTTRLAAERAIRAAMERLDRVECAAVLSDFKDGNDRTLRERLAALGQTPRSYLQGITYRESFDRRCQDPTRLAFTYVGSGEVLICGTQFWQTYQRNPSYVEALIIHEMMHTLGLRENPPSSAEISARVLERCW